jgi:hypothetical protein
MNGAISDENKGKFRETLERYCNVIDANTALNKYISNGKVYYECMNKYKCEKNGGCRNEKFCTENKKS